MKQGYSTVIATSILAMAGVAQASADSYSVSINDEVVTPSTIEVGKPYIFRTGASIKAGNEAFFAGTGYKNKGYGLSNKALLYFEKTGEKVDENEVYYLKNHAGEYIALPGSAQFFTKQVERAWKVIVVEAEYRNPEEKYTHTEEGKDPKELKGIDGMIQKAKDGDDSDNLDLRRATYIDPNTAAGEVIILEAYPTDKDKYAKRNALLSKNPYEIGVDYNQNGWVIRPAITMDAKEALQTEMNEIVPEGKKLSEYLKDFRIGSGAGEYNAEKYKKLNDLWQQAQDVIDGKLTLTPVETDTLQQRLRPAFDDFTQHINPLVPGYYIITNWRGEKESGYDGAALYDGGAVTPGAEGLLWSGKKGDDVDYEATDELSYNTAKFVWEVTSAGEDGKFHFRNLETGRYIGPQPKQYVPIRMTETPEAAFSIGANPALPGFLTFTSDKLFNSDGIHAQVSGFSTVVWDRTSNASSWHARTLTNEQVDKLRALIAQPKRNRELKFLVAKARDLIETGKVYFPVNENGEKLDSALTGKMNTVDGLVTKAEQLKCPMADPDEGKDIGTIIDGNLTNYFHSTWHGGEHAWNANHFLQFQIDKPVDALILKWGERNVGNAANGAPKLVRMWGATDEAALAKDKAQKVREDGQPVDGQFNYDAWKKDNGWEAIGVGEFDYSTKMLNTEGAETGRKVGFSTVNFDKPYKYFRMEVVTRANGGSGWFYGSEFRVYQGKYDVVASPNEAVPADVRKELNTLLAKAIQEVKAEKATDETIETFKKALDKYRENYPDPSRVTEVSDVINKRLEKAQEGPQLGYYAEGSKKILKEANDKIQEDLKAITDKRPATVAEINDFVARLNAALTTFESQLKMPQDGIYMIQSESSNVSVAKNVMAVKSSSTDTFNQVIFAGQKKNEDNTYVAANDRNQHLEYYWQVTKVDGGYTFRNLLTGLYLKRKAGNGEGGLVITQSETPYTIKVEFINYPGAFRFVVSDGKDKKEYPYINAQPGTNRIVTWNSADGNDNSAFSFQPVEESAVNSILDNGFFYDLPAKKGFSIVTLPIATEFDENSKADFYTVLGQNPETKDIVLKKVEGGKLTAGQAYVVKPNDDNTEGKAFLYAQAKNLHELNPIHKAADAVNGLHGTFEFVKLNVNNGLFSPENDKVVLSEKDDKAAANTGYFGKMPETKEPGDAKIPANQIVTLIKSVTLQSGKKTKGVFSLSGVRVDDVNSLPAGIYVINGQKVIVK